MNSKHLPEQGGIVDELQLYAAQVMQLYGHAPLDMAATAVSAAVLTVILRNHVSHAVLFPWFACLLLITLLRVFQVYHFRSARPAAAEAQRWGSWLIAGLALSGAVWGTADLILLPAGSLLHQAFLVFVLAGMVARTNTRKAW